VKTAFLFCGLWRVEKRIYSRAQKWVQKVIETAYLEVVRLRLALKRESLKKRREDYWKNLRFPDRAAVLNYRTLS
jgi:hypothetical protein